MAAPLRLAAVDGKRVRGIKRPRHDCTRPPPPSMVKMMERLAESAHHSEAAVKALWEAALTSSSNPVVLQALAREALINLQGLGNLADYLAKVLPDPTRW